MKRRKFLGLGVLSLIGVKPLVGLGAVVSGSACTSPEFIDGTCKNPIHTLAEAKAVMEEYGRLGSSGVGWEAPQRRQPPRIIRVCVQSMPGLDGKVCTMQEYIRTARRWKDIGAPWPCKDSHRNDS